MPSKLVVFVSKRCAQYVRNLWQIQGVDDDLSTGKLPYPVRSVEKPLGLPTLLNTFTTPLSSAFLGNFPSVREIFSPLSTPPIYTSTRKIKKNLLIRRSLNI